MFPGCFNANGQLRVQFATPPVGARFNHGIACGSDYVFASSDVPDVIVNGLPASDIGQLSITLGGIADHVQGGIPFTEANQVDCVELVVPSYFQNGLPFNNGKITVEVVPIAGMTAFSDGFDAGAFS